MHACALVVIPAEGDIEQLVNEHMAPWDENLSAVENVEAGNGGPWWDWWQIGGRYTGALDGYNPREDPAVKDLWPTDRPYREEDTQPVETVRALAVTQQQLCFTIVAGETVLHRENWDGENWGHDPDFDTKVLELLRAAPDDARVTVVDYHS